MGREIIYDFHTAEPVEAGGFVVVRRTCIDQNRPGALASFNGITRLVSMHTAEDDARRAAEEANARLGNDHVPYPFGQEDEED